MAGAFSGHIIDCYQKSLSNNMNKSNPNIITSGSLSFDPSMHGSSSIASSSSHPPYDPPTLQQKLTQRLGPEYISTRPGPGGGAKLTYAEGWKIINLANEVFGFDGWSSSIVTMSTDFMDFDETTRRYSIGITAVVRVTLVASGTFHEDVGYGTIENTKSRGQGLDKCKKEAVTDGLKRALRNFGNLLGNCLYDKGYAQEVTKIKVPPPKFDKSQLHRRPEFAEPLPPNNPPPPQTNASIQRAPTVQQPQQRPIPIPQQPQQAYIPPQPQQALLPQQQQRPPQPNTSVPQQQRPPKPNVPTMPQPNANSSSGNGNVHSKTVSSSTMSSIEYDGDDSFMFGSEDDAFLATVDLGEGDIGRPILCEGEEFDDESTRNNSVRFEDVDRSVIGEQYRENKPPVLPPARSEAQQQQQKQNRLAAIKAEIENQPADRSVLGERASTGGTILPSSNIKPIIPRVPLGRQQQNQNRVALINSYQQQSTGQQSASNSQRRPDTPTGGFRFPTAAKNIPVPPSVHSGVKRNADGIPRKPGPGMGLSNNSSTRTPLGTLSLEPDGKRIKR
ncbi:RAD52 DNA repair protein [Armillaria luteobubalina]|uniref:RAD52 DNA repair protein n=1 Tax=Armillaria luteobubalina TaxID=153913 RepID=A0AA39Q3M0_9AGAR|nr:RAD52 DNA repair protein [Armillaria luteobubalina]